MTTTTISHAWMIAACFIVASSTAAADSVSGANKFLEKRHAAVMSIVNQEVSGQQATGAREEKLRSAIDELLDFQELSRRALADHWDELEANKRTEFVSLLTQLVQRSYQKNLESIRNYQVKYDSAKPVGDSVLVHTVARSKKNRRAPAVEIDYTLMPQDGGYRVYDIATDGVSLVTNYRRQFNKIIRRDGWDALVDRMKKRLAEGSDTI